MNHLFSFSIFILLITQATFAVAGERDDLYKKGLKAFKSEDHVAALKNLYAFYILNESDIGKKQEFKNKLLKKISTSEAILKLSFASNSSVLKNEKRWRIFTKKGGGSFTGTGMEIDDLLNSKQIDLKAIQEFNHKTLTMP